MKKIGILILLAAVSSVGCTREITLNSPDGQQLGKATVVLQQEGGGLVTLNRDGVVYQGSWNSAKVDESRNLASRFGMGSRQYQNYKRGWTAPLYRGEAVLQSEKSSMLNCEFLYRGGRGRGHCQSDHEQFAFVVES